MFLDISKLRDVIENYNQIVENMKHGMNSNNQKFCEELEKIIDGI